MRTTNKTKTRQYLGENKAWYLLKWLNEPRNASEWGEWSAGTGRPQTSGNVEIYRRAVRRVSRILDAMLALHKLAEKMNWNQDPARDAPLWEKYCNLGESVNKGLRRYRTYPAIQFNEGRNKDRLWRPSEDSVVGFRLVLGASCRSTTIEELHAILTVEDGLREGWLKRVRRCAVCRRWFFARRAKQRHCSSFCRKKEWQSTERYKRWRRKHYWNHEKRLRVDRASKQHK